MFKLKRKKQPDKKTRREAHMANKKFDSGFPPPNYKPTPINALCANALDLTAPASDALLKNRKNAWVQLAGHPGSFAPAGPHTIWKKRLTKENNETVAYQALMNDKSLTGVVPRFYREVEYNGDIFIEIEDLLQHFSDPSIMDIKMGTRTFLESEVKNPVLRKDLYEKMVKLDQNEPTEEEHEQKAITKLRYMQFREKGSSTAEMGFRIEAIRMSGEPPNLELKRIRSMDEVSRTISKFIAFKPDIHQKLLNRIEEVRTKFEKSTYFKNHEIIGSSLLVLWDKQGCVGVWMIDFAKTLRIEGKILNHRSEWEVGSHETGYLKGVDTLYDVLSKMNFSQTSQEESSITKPKAPSYLIPPTSDSVEISEEKVVEET